MSEQPTCSKCKKYSFECICLINAIGILNRELIKDKEPGSYYWSWQSNIAMAFVDEYQNVYGDQEKGETIRKIANNAAIRFLDNLNRGCK